VRILLITQLFDPENAIKGLSFVRDLVARGHQVEVVTTFPSYPGGVIYPGYKMRWRQVQESEGLRIVRVPSYITHNRSAVKRLLGYASFTLSAFVYSLFSKNRPDLIYSYYPPMVGGVGAALLGWVKRRPFIYDVQDLWPEALVATKMVRNPSVIRLLDTVIGWVYRRASAIVVLSDGYKAALLSKNVPEYKIHRVYNWSDESRLRCGVRNTVHAPNFSKHFDIVYAGNLGAAQALDAVLDAAHILQSEGNKRVRFVFIGDGVEKERLKQRAASMHLDNLVFKSRVSPEEVGGALEAADALLAHLANDPVFTITVPSKTQAYLAAGRPILMAVAGESSEIVARAKAGIAVHPEDPASIAAGAARMADTAPEVLQAWGDSARTYYQNHMSQKNGVDRLSEIFDLVCAKK